MAGEADVIAAIKESAGRQENSSEKLLVAMGTVSNDVRDLATSIAKGFAQQRPVGGNSWHLLFAVGALIFGLLTPMYSMVQSVGDSTAKTESKIDDHIRRDADESKKMARMEERLKAIEGR